MPRLKEGQRLLEKVIRACLAKQREERPESASNVVASFSSAPRASTPAPAARAASTTTEGRATAPPQPRVNRLRPGTTLAVAATTAVLAFAAWVMFSKPKEVVKEVPKVVVGSAAQEGAARQKQRADDLEKKQREEDPFQHLGDAQQRLRGRGERQRLRCW